MPGTMQAGIVSERNCAGLSPITGWSAPAAKLCRQRVMRPMKSCGFIAVSRSRLAGLALIISLQCSIAQTASMPPCCAASICEV